MGGLRRNDMENCLKCEDYSKKFDTDVQEIIEQAFYEGYTKHSRADNRILIKKLPIIIVEVEIHGLIIPN